MIAFLIKRLALAAITIAGISVISFVIIQLPPGDYASIYVMHLLGGEHVANTPAKLQLEQQLRIQLGLDKPLIVQYAKWAGKLVRLDFGISLAHGKPIVDLIGDKLVNTVVLALGTILFTWMLSIPIGIYSALRHNSPEDYTVTFVGFLGLAVPDFLLALVLMWISFAYFGASVGGLYSPEYLEATWSFGKFIDLVNHLWIPALVLGTAGTAGLIRIIRNNLLDELAKPYIVAARARGMSEWKLVIKYPVRMALNPFISTIGYLFPFLLSGSVIVSLVLGLPTVGPLLFQALFDEDMYLGSSLILLMGMLTVLGTLVSDILLALFDPRIRLES